MRIVDLSRDLYHRTPSYPGQPPIIHGVWKTHAEARAENNGVHGNSVMFFSMPDHGGTHIDAPRHFAADGASLGEIPLADLIVPLAVIDLRDKAAASPDAAVEPADIARWERRHGRLPPGCCVAMLSGIDPLTAYPALFGGAGRPPRGPGFSPAAVEMLLGARSVKGIAVDGLSIDPGPAIPAYPVHRRWLRSGRWAIEAMANLAALPPHGAILIVGAPPLADATGLPIRAVALF